jgi:phosphoglycolate phosphatase
MSRLILFDLDGTLVDSQRDIADAANAVLVSCGARPLAVGDISRMVGDGAATLTARAFAAAGMVPPADAVERYIAAYEACLLGHTLPYPGIPEALAALASRGPLGVLTNKPFSSTTRLLDELRFGDYFPEGTVVAGNERFPLKPDPAGLLHLAARAGISAADTVLVGDSPVDWRTARNAGAVCCVARYGFGFRSLPEDGLRPGDLVVDDPAQLATILSDSGDRATPSGA